MWVQLRIEVQGELWKCSGCGSLPWALSYSLEAP